MLSIAFILFLLNKLCKIGDRSFTEDWLQCFLNSVILRWLYFVWQYLFTGAYMYNCSNFSHRHYQNTSSNTGTMYRPKVTSTKVSRHEPLCTLCRSWGRLFCALLWVNMKTYQNIFIFVIITLCIFSLAPALIRQASYGTIKIGLYHHLKRAVSGESEGEIQFPAIQLAIVWYLILQL